MSQRRLNLISGHVSGFFHFPHDSSLEEFRKRSAPFDAKEIQRSWFAPFYDLSMDMIDDMVQSPLFD